MTTIKMTAKRQATFPTELCEDMRIGPGDELIVEHKLIQDELVWVLKPRGNKLEWLGALRKYAQNKSHEMDDIRRSIADAGKK
jgi:bifunctional DNA-binding transcriptional regulator/antitoxin component of YhaV-PrlF toxin-antitoxin module